MLLGDDVDVQPAGWPAVLAGEARAGARRCMYMHVHMCKRRCRGDVEEIVQEEMER